MCSVRPARGYRFCTNTLYFRCKLEDYERAKNSDYIAMSSVLILGGDGYLGWPTAMYFSARGHKVTVVDNYMRRNLCDALDAKLLYPVPDLPERARVWHELTGYEINVAIMDLAEPQNMRSLLADKIEYQYRAGTAKFGVPDTVIHYAEQPSAPYSQFNHATADATLVNNLRVTNNLMWAAKDVDRDIHIIKLGTMGEYGTPNIDIEEGWLEVDHKGRTDKFLYPRQASSVYHTTKIMDTDLLWFGVRTWDLKVTDLMQGPVYGISTEESKIDSRLNTIFNYDEIFGTIINRFVSQSIIEYPLTVYGRGGQTRGYININDTLQCVYKSYENSPGNAELRIFNQIMETFSVNELAEIISSFAVARGFNATTKKLPNPRKEKEEHYYNPAYQGLIDLGVKPHYLRDGCLEEIFDTVESHKDNIDRDIIFKGVQWA